MLKIITREQLICIKTYTLYIGQNSKPDRVTLLGRLRLETKNHWRC